MSFDDLPFYDFDPDAREQATEASRARVRDGFRNLIEALEAPALAAREARQRRWQEVDRRFNQQIGQRDGHFTPEDCSIPVSPTLMKWLGTKRMQRSSSQAPT